MEKAVQRWLARCEIGSTYVAVFSVLLMMCLTTVDAVGRYFFSRPLGGAYELTEEYLMLATIFLGTAVSYRRGGLIRVTIAVEHLPKKAQTVIGYIAQICTTAYGLLLVVATVLQLSRTVAQGTTLGTLPLPKWPGTVFILIGLSLLSLLLFFDLLRVHTGKSSLFREKSPTAQ